MEAMINLFMNSVLDDNDCKNFQAEMSGRPRAKPGRRSQARLAGGAGAMIVTLAALATLAAL